VRLERETGDVPNIYFTISDTTGIWEGKTYNIRDGFYATVSVRTQDSMTVDELSTLNGEDLDGSVTITKVKQPSGTNFKSDGILSGIFHFSARSGFTTRKVNVTEGRFDFAVR
jgi:hypothetical protein